MSVIDIDLDFFLNDVPNWPPNPRLSDDEFTPWKEADVRRFLEQNCGLSTQRPVTGRFVTKHDEAFHVWKQLIADRTLTTPFEIVHIDSHADLGCGSGGHIYLMSNLLFQPVADRPNLIAGNSELNEGNYLLFVMACRWVSSITYVANPKVRNDLFFLHLKDFDQRTNALQLKPSTEKQIYLYNSTENPVAVGNLEPEVPFQRVKHPNFSTTQPFDSAILCHSPRYTPPSSDRLIPVIMEYIDDPSHP